MFSIGEFSMMTGIPVRTLRFYHEQALIVPAAVDPETNYRTYDLRNLEVANVIVALRELEFSLDDIRGSWPAAITMPKFSNTWSVKELRSGKAEHYQNAIGKIDQLIHYQRQAHEEDKMRKATSDIRERDVEPILVAGIRMKGLYSDCGHGFATLGKWLGRHIAGKPLCLFYDGEYREDDANFEPCMPIRKTVEVNGISVRELPAAALRTLLHHGPYEDLSHSYARLLKYVNERDYELLLPTREVYLKGPGMIFRGNPKKYVTEIQIPIAT